MTIKLLLLKSGENIISDVKELVSEDPETNEKKVCGFLLNTPQKLIVNQPLFLSENPEGERTELQVSMSPWIYLSNDKEIVIGKDWVVTIVEPIEDIKQMYEEKTNGFEINQDDSADKQSNSSESN